jgi:hypothetical protein
MSTRTLKALQTLFADYHYLIVDEKSMIDLKMLALINARLREIFPARSMEPFSGINFFLCSDFF